MDDISSAPKVGVLTLTDAVVDRIKAVVCSPATVKRLAVVAAQRASCEGWLKVELLHDFRVYFPLETVTIHPESVLATSTFAPTRSAADLVLRSDAEEVIVELKTFPTNYGGSGKPITNFINGVIDDLQNVASRR